MKENLILCEFRRYLNQCMLGALFGYEIKYSTRTKINFEMQKKPTQDLF